MIDAVKSFNSGYELMTLVNINRLLLDGCQLHSRGRCLCRGGRCCWCKKEKKQNKKKLLFFYVTLNTEFTSPPSCQCERAPVHYCQTRPSLACEELSKQLKFAGRILCVWSQVLSQGASPLFPPFPVGTAAAAAGEKKVCRCRETTANTAARHTEIRGGRCCHRCFKEVQLDSRIMLFV